MPRKKDVAARCRMMRKATKEEANRYMEKVLEFRGYVYPYQEFWYREDPDFAEAEFEWYKQVRIQKALPLKYKELIFIVACLSDSHERGLRTHIRKGLDLGLTKDEILETIQVASHTFGGGVPVFAVRILMEILGSKTVSQEPHWNI